MNVFLSWLLQLVAPEDFRAGRELAARVEEVFLYDEVRDELELAPTGDDYNNVLTILRGR